MATIDYENEDDTKRRRKGLMETLFGPSRREVWTQLAEGIGAQYVDGGFWRGDKVVAEHGPWTITLDTYTVSNGKSSTTYTRLRAPYVSAGGFHFTIYRKSIFSPIGKLLGMQDIEIGDPLFDDAFIIKSNGEAAVRRLLASPRLRALISAQPSIYFSVKDDEGWFGTQFPEGVDELYFQVMGVIRDVERLEKLYELFAATLEELCRLRLAREQTPGVDIR